MNARTPLGTWRGGIAADTLLMAETGPVTAAGLVPGLRVRTRDHGLQPVETVLSGVGEDAVPLVDVAVSVLGATQVLTLRRDQPVLLCGWLLNALLSAGEVTVEIGHFQNGDQVAASARRRGADIVLPVFRQPELVQGNGVWLAFPGADASFPSPALSPGQLRMLVESGLFTRRPGEARAHPAKWITLDA